MHPATPIRRKKLPLVPLGIAAVIVGAVGFLCLRGLDYRGLELRGMAIIRSMGPWKFFAAMAVLPSFGFPLSLFTLIAAELFASAMTMTGVIFAALAAITINVALTYFLSRYAFRPVLSRLAAHYGYTIPKVTASNALTVAIAVRVTPGPPFFVQGCLLGMAEVPFKMYMVVSMICQMPWMLGAIILGKGIFNGNFKLVLYGIGLLVVATLAIQWIRKKYASRPA